MASAPSVSTRCVSTSGRAFRISSSRRPIQTPLAPEELSVPLFQRVYAALRERYETGTPVTLGALETQLTGEEMAHLSAVMNKDDQLVNEDALRDYVGVIRQQYARRNQEGGGALLEMARRLKEKKGYGG